MIKPLLCGIQQCPNLQKRGNHGIMRSIDKDVPRYPDNNARLLKQKKSLKFIAHKHNTQALQSYFQQESNVKDRKQDIRKSTCIQMNNPGFIVSQSMRPNNSNNTFCQLQENRRNLQIFDQNKNATIQYQNNNNRPSNICINKSSQSINDVQYRPQSKRVENTNFANTYRPLQMVQDNMNCQIKYQVHPASKNQISYVFEYPKQNQHNVPYQPAVNKLGTQNLCPSSGDNFSFQSPAIYQNKNLIVPVKNIQNTLFAVKSQRNINSIKSNFKDQAIQFISSPLKSNQNHNINPSQNFQEVKNIMTYGKQQVGMLNCQPSSTIQMQKMSKYKIQRMTTQPSRQMKSDQTKNINDKFNGENFEKQNIFESFASGQNFNGNYVKTQNFEVQQIKINLQKQQHQKLLTRQNSTVNMGLSYDNTKFSMMTTKTNDSQPEKSNRKQVENRFNLNKCKTQLSHFGNSMFQPVFNHSNFQMQKLKEKLESQDERVSSNKRFTQPQMKENQENENLNGQKANNRDKTSIQHSDINSIQKQESITFDNLVKNQDSPPHKIERTKGKLKSLVSRPKKPRFSFFDKIQHQRSKFNQAVNSINKNENESSSKKQLTEDELNQLSTTEIKNAESFVESEGSSSDASSQLQYVVHSTNNLKLKSLAFLKNLNTEEKDSIKFDR